MARPLPARLLLARLLLAALLLTGAAQARANAVSLGLWPTADPDAAVFCAVRLDSGRMTALEVQGLGRAPAPAVRWAARPQDVAALMAALAALVSGDLDGTDPTGSRFPAPPHASVTWMAQVDGRLDSGLYIQPGLELPPPLAALVAQVLPGGLCARALAAPAPAAP